jgi:hybrid cluster-associated redox disulfide protein
MDTPMLDIHSTVEEVLQKWPRAFSVFMKNRTGCVGCFLQKFCTLKDVAETYQIPVQKLIDEIEHVSEEIP